MVHPPSSVEARIRWRYVVAAGVVSCGALALLAVVVSRPDGPWALFAALWHTATLLSVFAIVGWLPLLAIAAAPGCSTARRVISLVGALALVAAFIGLVIYSVIPAHFILGLDQSRGMQNSLWELHGDELSYAEQYRLSDPPAYDRLVGRVASERWAFLGVWGLTSTSSLIVILGLWWFRRWRRRPVSSATRPA